ncbi:pyridoxamine 5'-phosphate oxidase family protein [Curtobacterium sp. CT11-45]|uniref:pyridoxamine 5'-phosphate oxidase family protein n=1 Tax=Curtobacterium sp. CT11-45 TaxID=3243037 RepID=UPI0039AF5F6E
MGALGRRGRGVAARDRTVRPGGESSGGGPPRRRFGLVTVPRGVDDAPVPTDPLALAASWLPAAADAPGPTMTLSTVGLDGYPDARTVLLSLFDGERLHFHTDSRSRKAAELAAVPRAAVTLHWPEAARQLVVVGGGGGGGGGGAPGGV